MYVQQQKKHKANKQAKEKTNKQKIAHKRANKQWIAHKGANKHVIKKTCYQAKEGVLEGQMWVWIEVHSSIMLEYG